MEEEDETWGKEEEGEVGKSGLGRREAAREAAEGWGLGVNETGKLDNFLLLLFEVSISEPDSEWRDGNAKL